jgi:hypothetical protein
LIFFAETRWWKAGTWLRALAQVKEEVREAGRGTRSNCVQRLG